MAYDAQRSEGSEKVHNTLRALFDEGNPGVVGAMKQFADFAVQVKELLLAGRGREIGLLLDRNFDLRASIVTISKENLRMIHAARAAGASSKFAGSGGAIIGTYEDEAMYARLERKLREIGCVVLKPHIA
jgi:glucuronokinase